MAKNTPKMETEKKPKKLDQVRDTFFTSLKTLRLVWQTDKGVFIGNLIAVLIPAVTPFLIAYIFKLVIDLVVATVAGAPFDSQRFTMLMVYLAIIAFVNRMAFSVQAYATRILYTKIPLTLYQLVLNKIVSLDLQYFEDPNFRDTLQKVRDSYDHRPLQLAYNLFFLFQSFTQVVIALVAIIHLNPFLGLVLTIVALPDLYNQITFSKASWGIWSDNTPYRKRYEYLTNLIQKGDSIKELKIFQTSTKFLKELSDIQTKFFFENRSIIRKQLGVNSAFNLFDTLVTTGISVYVILEAINRRISVGDISFYQSVTSSFNNGIGGMFRNLNNIFDQALYTKHVFELLDIEPTLPQSKSPIKIDFKTSPVIEFKNVSFSYPGQKKKIFNNFSLTINPGEKIALVGENGAGKTTLIKLLARFYDVTEGEILIDGKNIKDLDLETWYRTIGVLFQDFIKYEYPVKDNIYFGKIWEKENLAEIIEAAKGAGAADMIKRFDHEYNQMLGKTFEGGIELSGGQWQKVALARAFFRNAPILVLDEPTAAIDAKAESEIFGRVEKLSKSKSVIIISHRFSTVRNADKIYVIDKGKIIESGDHKSLMKKNGQYATLFNLQAKGYK